MTEPARHRYLIENHTRGDTGTPSPHVAICCASCGKKELAPLNASSQPPATVTNQVFRNRGWLPGRTRAKDFCPNCKPHARNEMETRRGKQTAISQASFAPPQPPPVTQMVAPAKPPIRLAAAGALLDPTPQVVRAVEPEPAISASSATERREPSRQDRRRILDKLSAVYDDDIGYKAASSDVTVAANLDVPRMWVTEIRDDFFGPHTNEAQRHFEVEGLRLEAVAQELQKRALALGLDAERFEEQVKQFRNSAPRGIV